MNINVHKPLKRGKLLLLADGKKVLVLFKYERLSSFCYICGVIDHQELDCKVAVSLQKNHKKINREFGLWLRADGNSPASTIFGKSDSNLFGMRLVTKSQDGESHASIPSIIAKGKHVVVAKEPDESETPGLAVEVGRVTCTKNVVCKVGE